MTGGWVAVTRDLIRDPSISALELRLYMDLESYADREGICFPSHKTLAADLDVCVATIKTLLGKLRDRGLIEWMVRTRDNGSTTSCEYRLLALPDIGRHEAEALENGVASAVATPPSVGWLPPSQPAGYPEQESVNENQLTTEPKRDAPQAARTARGTRLPADWRPSRELLAWARSKNINDEQVEAETEKFLDWWPAQPGAKGVKLDWGLTWKTWQRRAAERSMSRAAVNGNGRSQFGTAAVQQRNLEMLAQMGNAHPFPNQAIGDR